MAKEPPKPTRFLVFSADGVPVADVPFAERARTIAGLPNGTYRGISRNDLWILDEEQIRVPAVRMPAATTPAAPAITAAVAARRAAQQEAERVVKKSAEATKAKVSARAEAEELERVRSEASARAEREWREKREEERQAIERAETIRLREAERLRQEAERTEAVLRAEREREEEAERSEAERSRYKPMPVPALPTKLPPSYAPPAEPAHPLLSRIKFRSPVQSLTIESLLQEFVHDNAVRTAEHEKKFNDLRSSIDMLDQTLYAAALENYLIGKRPMLPIERCGAASDIRAAIELCRMAVLVVPELTGLMEETKVETEAPNRTPAKSELAQFRKMRLDDSPPKTEARQKPETPKVGVWVSPGAWKCGCSRLTVRDRPKCLVCDWKRPDFVVVAPNSPSPVAPVAEIHETHGMTEHATAEHALNGKYLNAVPTPNIIPIVADAIQLKAPLLKAESQRRPVLIVGGVEAPEQTAWLRRALGGTVLWKSIPKHAGSSSIDPVVKSVAQRKASAVIMLEDLISHNVSTQIKNAAKLAGVPYVYGGKAGRGRLEQAVQGIERFMESHQEAKKT